MKQDGRRQTKKDDVMALCLAKSDRERKLVASQQSPFKGNSTTKLIIPTKKIGHGYDSFATVDKQKVKVLVDYLKKRPIDQIVEGIYRALESTEEKLDGRCDDIYFPKDLSISALTSKIEAIQGELVEIQSYIARRPEASPSIDRRNNKSTNIHQQISVDKASN
ncbi:hypothetical protein F2Q68_00010381 [Brassica cretica]|uniref:Uncharacterized protein n=1 Tax=Brassica cretica TaxID=69181 RepID=A0A3N6S565_BRACR|nr:hypothetical protein F2Q68_00010381 [Brassica cretica]